MSAKVNADRRCSECIHKEFFCETWDEKTEKTVSGWDKNRFAMSCREYEPFRRLEHVL